MTNGSDPLADLDLSVTRSCWNCHKRKIRCNKELPCATCVRTKADCVYPEIEKRKRTKRLPVSAILSRLAQLEKKVSTLGSTQNQAEQDGTPDRGNKVGSTSQKPSWDLDNADTLLVSGSRSRYFSDAMMASIATEAKKEHPASELSMLQSDRRAHLNGNLNVRTLADHSAPQQPERVPDFWQASQLWQVFISNVDPLLKVLHLPTTKPRFQATISDPGNATDSQAILSFAICYAATLTLQPSDVESRFYIEKSALLKRFGEGIEQYLTKLTMIMDPSIEYIQAFVIYLTFLRVNDTSRAVWILTGLAVRIAQSVGLHKDGTKFKLPPFEIEMRRRLFWQLHILDVRAAEDYGLQSATQAASSEFPLYPSNVNDAELTPSMSKAPEGSHGFTDITLALLRIQTTDMVIHESLIPIDTAKPKEARSLIAQKRKQMQEATSRVFENSFIPASPEQYHLRYAAELIWKLSMAKSEFLLLFRAFQHGILDEDQTAREDVLRAACTILEYIPKVYVNETFRRFSWYPKSYPQYYAIGFVVQQLYSDEIKDMDLAQRAQRAVQESFASLEEDEQAGAAEKRGAIWVALCLLKEKAFKKLVQRREAATADLPTPTPPESFGDIFNDSFDLASFDDTLLDIADFEPPEDWDTLVGFPVES